MPVTRHRKAVLILVCLLALAAPLVLVAQERTFVQVPSSDGPANRAAIAKICWLLLLLASLLKRRIIVRSLIWTRFRARSAGALRQSTRLSRPDSWLWESNLDSLHHRWRKEKNQHQAVQEEAELERVAEVGNRRYTVPNGRCVKRSKFARPSELNANRLHQSGSTSPEMNRVPSRQDGDRLRERTQCGLGRYRR